MIHINLERIFNIALYVIVILPILLIATGGGFNLAIAIAALAVCGVSWFAHQRKWGHQITPRTWNIIVFGFVGFALVQVLFMDVAVLDGAIQLLIVLTCVRLFSRLSVREESQIFVLSFMTLAAATTVNEDMLYGIVFAVYVLAGTFGLAVFHLRNELLTRPRLAFRTRPSLDRPYAFVLAGMSAVVLSTSLAIFFAFPRVGLGFFAPQDRDGMSMVGFSESVELGGHGLIRDNPAVVLRVEFPDGRPTRPHYHWRMLSFDFYDGKSWSRTKDQDGMGGAWHRDLDTIYPSQGAPQMLQMYLEPLDTTLLPTLHPTQSIKLGTPQVTMPFGSRSGRIRVDSYHDIRHTIPSNVGVPYMIWIGEERTTPNEISPREADPAFLQLPSMSPEFAQLARRARGNANEPQRIAANIEDFLESGYTYTTDLPEVGESPVEDFLFRTRRGHCEYFATAATLILRQNNIPARIVNGFYGGQWNNVGNYWAVRQGDAHSWVEYYDPQVGWLKLDPTPPSDSSMPNPVLDAMRKTMDASRLLWTKWVIEYDLAAQITALKGLADAMQGDSEQKTNSSKSSFKISKGLLFGVVLTLLALILGVTLMRRRKVDPLTHCFRQIENAARKLDVGRNIDEGPAAFLDRLAAVFPDASQPLLEFQRQYLASRFGKNVFDANQLNALTSTILKNLKRNGHKGAK